ncbi:MAG: V4R domain-containing protein [Thermoproteota archaeon]
MRHGEETRQTFVLTGEKIPKDFLCKAYLPGSKLAEFYLKMKNNSLDKVTKMLLEKKIVELCGFQSLDLETGEIIKGFLADISGSNENATEIAESLKNVNGIFEVKFSDNVLNGLIIDELFFPLMVGGERSFTLRVESFGAILKRLYEKFGTGAAVILYEMGLGMGESKFKSVVNRYHVDKQTALKIILAERSAKGWCIAQLEDFNKNNVVVVAKELFECLPFKDSQEKQISQFFRGYLAGIFQQLYGKNVNVTETECIAKGDSFCRFVVQVAK